MSCLVCLPPPSHFSHSILCCSSASSYLIRPAILLQPVTLLHSLSSSFLSCLDPSSLSSSLPLACLSTILYLFSWIERKQVLTSITSSVLLILGTFFLLMINVTIIRYAKRDDTPSPITLKFCQGFSFTLYPAPCTSQTSAKHRLSLNHLWARLRRRLTSKTECKVMNLWLSHTLRSPVMYSQAKTLSGCAWWMPWSLPVKDVI